jgi:hypothetical protein
MQGHGQAGAKAGCERHATQPVHRHSKPQAPRALGFCLFGRSTARTSPGRNHPIPVDAPPQWATSGTLQPDARRLVDGQDRTISGAIRAGPALHGAFDVLQPLYGDCDERP